VIAVGADDARDQTRRSSGRLDKATAHGLIWCTIAWRGGAEPV
jgi:hypothetical protein